MEAEILKKLYDKFFSDPDWSEVEKLIESYIEPMKGVVNIPATLTNDQMATEVRGRQLMVEQLERFLQDAKIIKHKIISPSRSFK
jgi:hypothetical protein